MARVANPDLRAALTPDARTEGEAAVAVGAAEAAEAEGERRVSKGCRVCCKYCCPLIVIVLLIVGLTQWAMYTFAGFKCSPNKIDPDYKYPGGGPKDLVPVHALLIEEATRWWGSHFTLQGASPEGGAMGASTGVWFQTWGPLVWTYVHQDTLGTDTFMAREQYFSFDGAHKVWRCDGTGPTYIISQGSHAIINWFRKLVGMYTSTIYNIWEDDKLVAVSKMIGTSGQASKHLVFQSTDGVKQFGSSFIQQRDYHGSFDKWFTTNEPNSTLPAWATNAATAFTAFHAAESKKNKDTPVGIPVPHVLRIATRWLQGDQEPAEPEPTHVDASEVSTTGTAHTAVELPVSRDRVGDPPPSEAVLV